MKAEVSLLAVFGRFWLMNAPKSVVWGWLNAVLTGRSTCLGSVEEQPHMHKQSHSAEQICQSEKIVLRWLLHLMLFRRPRNSVSKLLYLMMRALLRRPTSGMSGLKP